MTIQETGEKVAVSLTPAAAKIDMRRARLKVSRRHSGLGAEF
jgi:hypothetical protein